MLTKLQKISSRLPGVIYQFLLRPDGSSCFPYASEALFEIYGIRPAEVRYDASKVFAILHPDDLDGINASIQESAEHMTPWNYDYRVKFMDGSIKWLQGNAIPERKVDGSILWHGFITEITKKKQLEDALRSKTALLESQLNASIVGILIVNEDGKIILINSRIIEIFNVPQYIIKNDDDAPLLKHVEGLTKYPDKFIEKVLFLYDNKDHISFDEVELKSGVFLERYSAPILGENSERYGRIWTFHDITDRKRSERDLYFTNAAINKSKVAFFWLTPQGQVVYVNDYACQSLGYSRQELTGLHIWDFDPDFPPEAQPSAWHEQKTKGMIIMETRHQRKDGTIFPVEITGNYIASDGEEHSFVFVQDITERKLAEEEIRNLAFFDPLTRLPNRRLLTDRLQHALSTGSFEEPFGAVLFVDLDNFKKINDTKGHVIGDLLLLEVAKRIESNVREGDTVARLGGDEFVVVLEDLDSDLECAAAKAKMTSEKILVILSKLYLLGEEEHVSSASIGISLFRGGDNLNDLLRNADTAMYEAKKAGRNTLRFFDPSMQQALEERAKLEFWIREGLQNQQFRLFYQLQVDNKGSPIGAEALIRWEHPLQGMIPPGHFIPVAEETGLIMSLGQWVLETACAQLKQWEDHSLTQSLTIAVNVSARQFSQVDFVEQVHAVVLKTGINPIKLKLELTESLVLHNVEDAVTKMRKLKSIGIHFSMDDFGTGHSSLGNLKRLPLDQLKIDQSFVRDIAVDPSDAAIVNTIINMGKTLGMAVIAEGVETKEQLSILRQYGCQEFQGYLFGKPVAHSEFEVNLQNLNTPPVAYLIA